MILYKLLLLGLLLIINPSVSRAFIFDKYHVKVRVVDDNGHPVENANTGISFESASGKVTTNRGLSDSIGNFEASGNGSGYIMYSATKDGYYLSQYSCNLTFEGDCKVTDGEIKILLRKIENPMPMYARNTSNSEMKIEIPVVEEKVGFDLIAYDWVPPYGKGKYSDFIFFLERTYTDWKHQDCRLTITFANKSDGIQKYEEELKDGSQFKLLRFAPETGYEGKLELFIKADAKGYATNYNANMESNYNYFFKIRSKDNVANSALFGKIRGGFWFFPQHSRNKNTAIISLEYYVNPDHTRNLEFDTTRNLFDNLKSFQRIGFP